MNRNQSYSEDEWDHFPGKSGSSWYVDTDSDEALARQLQQLELDGDEALARCLQEMDDCFEQTAIYQSFEKQSPGNRVNFISGESSHMAGIQDSVDPDSMTYEQMIELGETIGKVSTGLSEEEMSRLPSQKITESPSNKKNASSANDEIECAICKVEYEKDDILTILPCAHKYHQDCVKRWLKENKTCCVCNTEVTLSE